MLGGVVYDRRVDIQENQRPLKRAHAAPLIAGVLAVGGAAAIWLFAPTGGAVPAAGNNDKITICHVAGRADDPANYVTLHLPPQAVYGNGGHFNENGTTQAGHEQDTLGECDPPDGTTTTVPDSTTSTTVCQDCTPVTQVTVPETSTTQPTPSSTSSTSPGTTVPRGTDVSSTTAPLVPRGCVNCSVEPPRSTVAWPADTTPTTAAPSGGLPETK
ncbi:MAG: hypothetical protein K0R44_14 [Thermomicrobiales bacterium]|jgi:hypothetical protein|nr:hypothetical protein [Thermomicrobiales bacterium]MDF3014789.1 hypothetical protein [Thermomicrobiales bacterium]